MTRSDKDVYLAIKFNSKRQEPVCLSRNLYDFESVLSGLILLYPLKKEHEKARNFLNFYTKNPSVHIYFMVILFDPPLIIQRPLVLWTLFGLFYISKETMTAQ
jgi:hypothetical protein